MGQKKKGSKKSAGQGSTQTGSSQGGTQKTPEAAVQANGSPETFNADSSTGTASSIEASVMNGHDDSTTSSSTDTSPSKPLTTPKGLPSLNGKPSDSAAKAKADNRSSTPRQGTQAQSDTQKALEGAVRDLRADLLAEKSRREEAETYLNLYKLSSWGLGFTTAACATLAIVSMLRCRN